MASTGKKPKEDWRLQKIEIEFMTWGPDKGRYAGKIKFENGESESFSFKIHPDMAQAYIDLMAEDIVRCADSLAERLVVSLGLGKQGG